MKFKISTKYRVVQTIEMLLGYFFALSIVYFFIKLDDMTSFIISSALAAFFLYYMFVIRMKISIEEGILTYKGVNKTIPTIIKLSTVRKLNVKKDIFFSSVTIKTEDDKKVSLYPANPEEFVNIVSDMLHVEHEVHPATLCAISQRMRV